MDHLCYFYFVSVALSCLFIIDLWSTAGKGLTSCMSCVSEIFLYFCQFLMCCPESVVVLKCIDS